MKTKTLSFTNFLLISFSFLAISCLEKAEVPKDDGTASSASSSNGATLPINHPPVSGTDGSNSSKASVSPPSDVLGSRFYMRSFLEEIFTSANNTSLNIILDKYLGAETEDGVSNQANYENMIYFGSPCDHYSEAGYLKACNNNWSNLYLKVNLPSTASRESVRVKMCSELTDNDSLVTAALAKVSLTTASDVTNARILSVFDLFYPGVVMDATTLNAFLDLNTAQKNAAETKTNQWRTILFTLCRTPEWQAL